MGKKRKKSLSSPKQYAAMCGNIQQCVVVYGSLPGTIQYNLVISEMDIEKGLARLIYTIVYSKIGG